MLEAMAEWLFNGFTQSSDRKTSKRLGPVEETRGMKVTSKLF